MFRPNRIGDHPLTDVSAANLVLPQTDANFAASLGTLQLHQVQTDSALTPEQVTCVNFNTGDAAVTYTITPLKTWSFGRFVSGNVLNDRPVMFSFDYEIIMRIAAVDPLFAIMAYIGYANANLVTVDITTTVNLMDTKVLLGSDDGMNSAQLRRLSGKGTIVNTLFNGGASGEFDTNPIGIWLACTSFSGSNVSIKHINGSISLYRYSKDIDTFDPTR